MNVRATAQAPEATKADLLAIFVDEAWSDSVSALDQAFGGALSELATAEGFEGKAGQTFSLHTLGKLPAKKVALVGIGSGLSGDDIKDAGGNLAKAAGSSRAASIAISGDFASIGGDAAATLRLLAEGVRIGSYQFNKYRTQNTPKPELEDVVFLTDSDDLAAGFAFAEAAAAGIRVARDLVNEPPDVCDPSYMAEVAGNIADKYGFEKEIFGMEGILKERMNLFAAVGRGATTEPKFIHLTYKGAGKIAKRIAYVGKGVTFDTGGYNVKVGAGMMNMHCDMGGGAAVLGAAETIGRLAPEGVEVHFIVPSAANMIAAGAYTVNEIITGRGGKTVEINNTDAEGRLLLADALAFAADLGVDEIVDLATLTGACVVALGEHYTALYSTDDDMATSLLADAAATGERFWRMPLDTRLRDKLKSPVADMRNTGDRWGGSITAALFLKEWVGDTAWTHLDIAGPAFTEKDLPQGPKGGTGAGVSALAWHAVQAGK